MLIGAILFASGMLVGIKLYKNAQQPFLDLTPISNYTEQDNTVVDEEGFNWSDYDNYIENKLKEDIIDD